MRDLVACLALTPRAATLLLVWLLELSGVSVGRARR